MFKFKPEKARFDVKINTIDGTHKKFTSQFRKERNSLNFKQNKLNRLKHQLETLETKDKEKYTVDDIKVKSTLKSSIDKLTHSIQEIENNKEELDYFYLTHDILVDYYGNDAQAINWDNIQDDIDHKKVENKTNELDKLNDQKNKTKKVKKVPQKRWKRKNQSKSGNIVSMLKKNKDTNNTVTRKKKAIMLDEFLTLTDSTYISNRKHKYNPDMSCPKCGKDRKIIYAEGICVCSSCGEAESVVVDSDRPNYKDNIPEKSGYPYKRMNHFSEFFMWVTIILIQFDGYEFYPYKRMKFVY